MNRPGATQLIFVVAAVLIASVAPAQETVTRGERLAIDIAADGRIVMNLAGSVWILPGTGGEARLLDAGPGPVEHPRWSPDASRIVFGATVDDHHGIWLHDLVKGETEQVSAAQDFDLHPAWHPDGERLVFASDRRDTGFDLWEVDLRTGLQWRLSNRPGDETSPAWSANGRHLVYVHHDDDGWSLVMRRHGEPEEVLVTSAEPIAAPSWRPDGSLITYWRGSEHGTSLEMVILSEPRLVRAYANGEKYEALPVAWLDRQRMYYTADGLIRQRAFNSWSSRAVPFRAVLAPTIEKEPLPERRELPRIDEPVGRLVVHAARLFDGIAGAYQVDRDIIIDGGQIVAVEAHAERTGTIVIDMGDLVVMPGLVDARARLPADGEASVGPLLLASGVTTLATTASEELEHVNTTWSGKALPGPRLLSIDEYPVARTSGLADALTPGLEGVLASRQARLVAFDGPVARRHAETPQLERGVTDVVVGSRRNGMPAGIGLHAELRALRAAGLTPVQALRAAGVNAAAAMGVDPALGRIAVGAMADLVFVDGDPLADVADALRVVAVVRNGRFFSVAGLIERAEAAQSVD
jgi:hypothetical protein